MLFEQSRIEAELAYARFLNLSGRDEQMPEVYANRLTRARDALAALDRGLSDGREFVAAAPTRSPTSPCTPTCIAPPTPRPTSGAPHVEAWLERVEAQPGFENDLEPLPAHALSRPVRGLRAPRARAPRRP